MPELRWTLLIIGVLFVAILAWWERRRPHQASSRQAPHISGEPRPVVNNDPSWGPETESVHPRVMREPTLTLPEIRTEARTREPMTSREPISSRELPIVDMPRVAGPTVLPPDVPSSRMVDMPVAAQAAVDMPSVTAIPIDRELPARELEDYSEDEFEADDQGEGETDGDAELEAESDAEPPLEADPKFEHKSAERKPAVPNPAVAPVVGPVVGELLSTPPPLSTVRPIVEWPPEDQRKLVSLRLVARPPDRFRGSLLRQALRAEGFILGDLDIFHKPDAENRAVLSAASVTKPGTFDIETMDTQRFAGLNLFAVLPGPRSPHKAFEELLLTARMLNERLEGALQDERGGPLTPMRIQAIRDALGNS